MPGDDFGLGVALSGFQSQQQDGLIALHLGDGADGVRAHGKIAGSPGWTPAPQNHAQRTVCCAALKLRPRYDTGTARTLTPGSQGSPKK
ncbi:MAG: hypothetical protein WDO73_10470 [Ignavibacteriota bacterium]